MSINPGGTYFIHNGQARDWVIDLDTRDSGNHSVQSWKKWDGPNQKWRFNQVDGGRWVITNVAHPDRHLSIENLGRPQDGTKLIAGDQPYQWDIWPKDQGKYVLCVPNTKLLVDLDRGQTVDGTRIHLWTSFDSPNQQWWVENA